MVRTVRNGAVVAGNDQGGRLKGDYFPPPEWLTLEYFTGSQTSVCWWEGCARYYSACASEGTSSSAARYPAAAGGQHGHPGVLRPTD